MNLEYQFENPTPDLEHYQNATIPPVVDPLKTEEILAHALQLPTK